MKLDLGHATATFTTVDDFGFALASRTAAPLAKLDELGGLTLDELMSQARSIRAVEGRLLEVLDRSLSEPLAIDHHLRELDPRVFSEDHDWRSIMVGLNGVGSEFDAYKRLAVVKYLQYLGSRQDLIKRVYSSKTLGEDPEPREAREREEKLRETAIFDRFAIAPPGDRSGKWVRLPRGEAIPIAIGAGQAVPLRLSTHVFALRRGEDGALALEGERDEHYEVPAARCRIGRSHDNEVSVDTAYRAVSRRHLVLEPGPGDAVTLTDLSSHGSFVRPDDLAA